MAAFELLTRLRQLIQSNPAKPVLHACFQADSDRVLELRPGMTEAERTAVLAADPNLATILIEAFSQQGSDLDTPITASLKVIEKIRTGLTGRLKPIEQQYATLVAQRDSILNAHQAHGTQGELLNKPALEAKFDKNRIELSAMKRLSRSYFWRAGGMVASGGILTVGDGVLLFDNFARLVDDRGTGDPGVLLAAFVLALIVLCLLLILTHLGLAPLLRNLLRCLQNDQDGKTSDATGIVASLTARGSVLLIMLTSSALTFYVSNVVASLRADLLVDGSGTRFVTLNTLGLPIINLMIHLCFMSAYSQWTCYRQLKDRCLDAITPLRETDGKLARIEIQRRRTIPILRELKRVEKLYARDVRWIHRHLQNHPGIQSEVERLATLLTSSNDASHSDGDDDGSVDSSSLPGSAYSSGMPAQASEPASPTRRGKSVLNNGFFAAVLVLISLVTGCSSRPKTPSVCVLLDNTSDFVASPNGQAAWQEALDQTKHEILTMPVGAELDAFSMADAHNYTPICTVKWVKGVIDGKVIVSAKDRKRQEVSLDRDLDAMLSKMRKRPVSGQTRIVESIYEILRSLCNRTTSSSKARLVIASDMEPFVPPQLTASRIIRSDADMKRCLQKVEDSYPPLGPEAPQVVIVYSPSVGILRQPPVCIERLKGFWAGFFSHIGCKMQWTSPAPRAVSEPVKNGPRS